MFLLSIRFLREEVVVGFLSWGFSFVIYKWVEEGGRELLFWSVGVRFSIGGFLGVVVCRCFCFYNDRFCFRLSYVIRSF